MKQNRIVSGEHHGITRYDVLLGLFYLSFLQGHQFSKAVEKTLQMNAGIVCDSLSCCHSMCRLFLKIQDWDGKQVSPRPRSRVEAVLF